MYGVHLITEKPDSPCLLVDRIKGEMYFACAEHDKYIGKEELASVRELLVKAGVRGGVEIIPKPPMASRSPPAGSTTRQVPSTTGNVYSTCSSAISDRAPGKDGLLPILLDESSVPVRLLEEGWPAVMISPPLRH